jgi:Tfp pilus assembly protein PilO
MDNFTKEFIDLIRQATSDEELERLIDSIYEAGIQDGTDLTLDEVREGKWKDDL